MKGWMSIKFQQKINWSREYACKNEATFWGFCFCLFGSSLNLETILANSLFLSFNKYFQDYIYILHILLITISP